MKYKILWLMALFFVATSAHAEPSYYKLKVSSLWGTDTNNFYEVYGSKLFIQTEMCLELALAKSAILVWEYPGSWDNRLVFIDYDGKSRSSCRVKRLLVETSP